MSEQFTTADFKEAYDRLGEEAAVDGDFFGITVHGTDGKVKRGVSLIFAALRLAADPARPATQDWVNRLSLMQQSVLMSAVRGADGMAKFHKHKPLVKWFRRCVLISAFDGVAITDPFAPGGGSFTGPIADLADAVDTSIWPNFPLTGTKLHDWRCSLLQKATDDFMDSRDELPAHYRDHFMHAVEVVGYKHPDPQIREFWFDVYERLVHALHTWPETEAQMDARLGDDLEGWKARSDTSSSCSD